MLKLKNRIELKRVSQSIKSDMKKGKQTKNVTSEGEFVSLVCE